jgi:hypothetical protein
MTASADGVTRIGDERGASREADPVRRAPSKVGQQDAGLT